MLLAIHKRCVPAYQGGQADVVYLVSSVETVARSDRVWCFTDGHAVEAVTEFSEDRVRDEVEEGIDDAADTPEVRRAVADAIMDQLALFGIERIASLTASGHELRVEYE